MCLRTRNTLLWLVICISMTSLAAIVHFEYDETRYSIPVFLKAIPIAIILLTLAGH